MNIYEYLDKIHDAVVDWDETFELDSIPGVQVLSSPALKENEWLISSGRVVHRNGRNYFVTESGHLWPLD